MSEFINGLDITSKDFPSICRTCLSQGELIPIFNTYVKQNNKQIWMIDLLKDFTKIEFARSDGLPPNICSVCIAKLFRMHIFVKQCLYNEVMLKLTRSTPLDTKNEEQDPVGDLEETFDVVSDSPADGTSTDEQKNYLKDCPISDPIEVSTIKINGSNEKSSQEIEPKNKNQKSKISKAQDSSKRSDEKPKRVTKPLYYRCRTCRVMYKSFTEIQTHRQETQHLSYYRLISCGVCHKLCHTNLLKIHMATHAPTRARPYKCTYCNKSFVRRVYVKRHMLIHTGEKPYLCDLCGKAFNQSSILKKHRKMVHKVAEPDSGSGSHDKPLDESFDCPHCKRSFETKASLQIHLRIHTDKRPHDKSFDCPHCKGSFETNASLQIHLRIHTGKRPFTCKICNKSFTQAGTCKSHQRTHTGERPFMCNMCGKTFSQPIHLVYHLRLHRGEKPYVCEYCSKAFTLKGNLVVHVRRHTKETPYLCDLCGKGFYDSSSRNKHKRIKHKIDVKVQVEKIRKTW